LYIKLWIAYNNGTCAPLGRQPGQQLQDKQCYAVFYKICVYNCASHAIDDSIWRCMRSSYSCSLFAPTLLHRVDPSTDNYTDYLSCLLSRAAQSDFYFDLYRHSSNPDAEQSGYSSAMGGVTAGRRRRSTLASHGHTFSHSGASEQDSGSTVEEQSTVGRWLSAVSNVASVTATRMHDAFAFSPAERKRRAMLQQRGGGAGQRAGHASTQERRQLQQQAGTLGSVARFYDPPSPPSPPPPPVYTVWGGYQVQREDALLSGQDPSTLNPVLNLTRYIGGSGHNRIMGGLLLHQVCGGVGAWPGGPAAWLPIPVLWTATLLWITDSP
jgi:hypothetical protein